MTLRELSGIMTNEDRVQFTEKFLSQTTEEDYAATCKELSNWIEAHETQLSAKHKDVDDFFSTLWSLIIVRDQYWYETGFRAGVHLVSEALVTKTTPLEALEDLSRNTRKGRQTA